MKVKRTNKWAEMIEYTFKDDKGNIIKRLEVCNYNNASWMRHNCKCLDKFDYRFYSFIALKECRSKGVFYRATWINQGIVQMGIVHAANEAEARAIVGAIYKRRLMNGPDEGSVVGLMERKDINEVFIGMYEPVDKTVYGWDVVKAEKGVPLKTGCASCDYVEVYCSKHNHGYEIMADEIYEH